MPEEIKNQEIERLNKKIAELEAVAASDAARAEDYLSGWKRAKADFINYKKDEEKHATNVLRFVKINFLKKFLPILDSLEEARKQKNTEVEAIGSQIMQVFKSAGLEKIEALGKVFDPNFYESIGVVESDSEENVIVEELRKGYMVEGEVIRPSLVKISIKKI
ncbi:MAG: nucleotide exchange factor GrpE [Patescibacteria group bacterium]